MATKIILISARSHFIREAKAYFPMNDIEILLATDSAIAAIDKICDGGVDAVVSDMFIGTDEVTGIMKSCLLRMYTVPPFIVLSPYISAALFGECADLGAAYCMPESNSLQTICERVLRAAKTERDVIVPDKFALKKTIAQLLSDLSIPVDCLGFKYLSFAIMLTVTEGMHMITKDVYPATARAFGTTPPAVERAMRLAISRAWAHGNYALQNRIFKDIIQDTQSKPTNTQFISVASRIVRFEDPEICLHSDI